MERWVYIVTADFGDGKEVKMEYPSLERAQRAAEAVLTVRGNDETSVKVQRKKVHA